MKIALILASALLLCTALEARSEVGISFNIQAGPPVFPAPLYYDEGYYAPPPCCPPGYYGPRIYAPRCYHGPVFVPGPYVYYHRHHHHH